MKYKKYKNAGNTAKSKKIKVKTEYVSKEFELAKTNSDKLKSLFIFWKKNTQTFWALKNVNIEVYDGESIGIIGLNGSGKSTLSNIISETLDSTTGSVTVNGKTSIIAIGAGLKLGLTGRENIRLKALMMGMTTKEIDEKIDQIIEFSELGPFIDQPVKGYSSGMRSKLGFSIAVHQDPDILIIDEALSVGDSTFAGKSAKKMMEFREQGKTIFFVSHSLGQVKQMCDKVLWLHYGEVKGFGPTEDILPKYNQFVTWFNSMPMEQQEEYKKRQRKQQLDYSVDELKEDIVANDVKSGLKRNEKDLNSKLFGSVNNHRFSLLTSIFIFLLIGIMTFTMLVTTSDVSMKYAIKNPKTFLSKHLFKPKKEKNKKTIVTTKEKKPLKSTESQVNNSTSKTSTSKTSNSTTSSSKPEETFSYSIKEGDTLNALSAYLGISADKVRELNPNVDFNALKVGQIIQLPTGYEAAIEQWKQIEQQPAYTAEQPEVVQPTQPQNQVIENNNQINNNQNEQQLPPSSFNVTVPQSTIDNIPDSNATQPTIQQTDGVNQ